MKNATDIDPYNELPPYSSLRYPPPKYEAKPPNPPIASATDFPLLNLPKLNQDALNLSQNNRDQPNLSHFSQDRQLNQDNAIFANRAPTGPKCITPQIVVTTNLGSRNKNIFLEQAANPVPFNFVPQDPINFNNADGLACLALMCCFVIFGVIAHVLAHLGKKATYQATRRRFLRASYIVSLIGIIVGSGLIVFIILTIYRLSRYPYPLMTTPRDSLNFSTVASP